jgi:hypothetical protein
MNSVEICFIFDSNEASLVSERLGDLGLVVHEYDFSNIHDLKLNPEKVNIVLIDLEKVSVVEIITSLRKNSHLTDSITYVMISPQYMGDALSITGSLLQTEFIEKPYNRREFILLIEKTIVVEKYRELMGQLSSEYKERIENYENIFDTNKNNVFESEKSDETFKRILNFERNLIERQKELNERIKEFSCFREQDFAQARDMLFANAMLDKLREKELLEARDTITAQEHVIDFAGMLLEEKIKEVEAEQHVLEYASESAEGQKKIIEAQEQVVEFSREEALKLHNRIKALYDEKNELQDENQRLKKLLEVKGDS